MRRLDELIAAATLLTRLPVARLIGGRAWPDNASAVWAYPIVGALVGVIGGAVVLASRRIGLSAEIAAILAIAAQLLLTGGLHEDGLADMADAFGGGATVARKLEIMRDSQIGTYGALALIVAIALRVETLASLTPTTAFAALIAAGALGRGAMLVPLLLLRPARADGVAATLQTRKPVIAAIGLAIAAAISAILPAALVVESIAVATLAALVIAAFARRQIGGYTGDVLGATAVIAECAALCVASMI